MSADLYPGRDQPALRNVSSSWWCRRVADGRKVGPSGAGKTTVANFLLRFWDPTQGANHLDRTALPPQTLDGLRGRIALVAQDTYLFNDTLEANVRLARPDASRDQVEQALQRAALADFVTGLPEGLQTRVGERGVQLSGGQRQRVAIARAFLKDAPLLVLDEATSHLDTISEQLVRTALDALMAERTTIVVAHRLHDPPRRPHPGPRVRPRNRGRRARRVARPARRLRPPGRAPDRRRSGGARRGIGKVGTLKDTPFPLVGWGEGPTATYFANASLLSDPPTPRPNSTKANRENAKCCRSTAQTTTVSCRTARWPAAPASLTAVLTAPAHAEEAAIWRQDYWADKTRGSETIKLALYRKRVGAPHPGGPKLPV